MEPQSLTKKRGGPRQNAGRKPGYKSPSTIKRLALKVLGEILQDESASPEARAMAACKLVDEFQR